jgi:hypothetical protein
VRILPARPEIRNPEPGDIGRAQPGPLEAPDDPLFPNQWALSNRGGAVGAVDADIDGPQAWDVEKGSATIVVAIIDEGVDTAHPDSSTVS